MMYGETHLQPFQPQGLQGLEDLQDSCQDRSRREALTVISLEPVEEPAHDIDRSAFECVASVNSRF